MERKSVAALIFSLLASACGGNSGGSDGKPQEEEKKSTGKTVLEGVWEKPCGIVEQSEEEVIYDRVTLTFEGEYFYSDIENYQDSNCQAPYPVAPNPKSEGTLFIGDDVITTGGLSATEIDTEVTRYNGAPFTIREYTIFRLEVNKLYFGKGDDVLDGESEETRPKSLDYERIFYKQ